MENKSDHPGVYVPPPLIYLAAFLAGIFLQRIIPVSDQFFDSMVARVPGWILLIAGIMLLLPAIAQFIRTRNTLITIRPAQSLQTEGIYAFSRNPMYLGLLLLYSGASLIWGNWWCLFFWPVVFLINQEYIIKREERYLTRRFGAEYEEYRSRVRKWI